ncbi:LRR receptor-like serine/threonine-protein kinase ER2 [Phragmites australis]|uniref:LRR receptor-like serine/threonine-protein kinase ER2 n=1 Tax=Phragmites australis TaxID=29695 RepID=UPI002D79ACC1|nr:LRR receptor-like serine/threonine-protein kinase ER2 [Phragmites australis]
MEMVDPDITDTCKDLGEVKKVFQLALLCSKRQPSDRPTMHEVVRVLDSLICPGPLPRTAQPPASQQSSTAPSYVSEYDSLRGSSALSCSNSSSASDAELFLKFGEVISQNTQ